MRPVSAPAAFLIKAESHGVGGGGALGFSTAFFRNCFIEKELVFYDE